MKASDLSYTGLNPAGSVWGQGLRFVVAGAATAGLDALTLFLLTEFTALGYFVAAAIGFTLGSTCNYFLSRRWIFVSGKFKPGVEFTFFMLTGGVGLFINQAVMWFFVDIALVNYLLAKVLSIGIVAAWNFTLKKKFVFTN